MAFSDNDMVNGYTRAELFDLSNDNLRLVMDRGFVKGPLGMPVDPAEMRTQAEHMKWEAAQMAMSPSPAAPSQAANPYAPTAWASDGPSEYDFQVPSGQLCRIRKIEAEMLIEAGILGQVTRLTGVVQQGIDEAEGRKVQRVGEILQKDPAKSKEIIGVVNSLVCVVVLQPPLAVPNAEGEVPAGHINVNRVNLMDRMAIMEEAMTGVVKLDSFRS